MKNPWLKKNPLLSMWLSGANAAAGQARGQIAAAAARQQTALQKEAVRSWTGFWLGGAKGGKRRR